MVTKTAVRQFTNELVDHKFTGGAANIRSDGEIAPSSYSGNKTASTTVAGQSEALATDVTKVRFHNLGPINYSLVSFGTSAANAEANAANGVIVPLNQTVVLTVPTLATHIAWLGDTGSVTINVIQGN